MYQMSEIMNAYDGHRIESASPIKIHSTVEGEERSRFSRVCTDTKMPSTEIIIRVDLNH